MTVTINPGVHTRTAPSVTRTQKIWAAVAAGAVAIAAVGFVVIDNDGGTTTGVNTEPAAAIDLSGVQAYFEAVGVSGLSPASAGATYEPSGLAELAQFYGVSGLSPASAGTVTSGD